MIAGPANCSTRNRAVRRADVAKAAGVSVTAVTHVLNDTDGARISAKTRQRVLDAAARLSYRPNIAARSLRTGRTQTVGLLLPDIGAIEYDLYLRIINSLAPCMEADDYHFLLLFRRDDNSHLRVIDEGRLDGIFVLQSDTAGEHLERLAEMVIPMVVLNKSFPVRNREHVGCVRADHESAMSAAVTELTSLECRSLLAVYDYQTWDANALLYHSFTNAIARLKQQGVSGSALIPHYPNRRTHFPDLSGVRTQFTELIRSGGMCDGIFINGDTTAETFIQVGLEHNLQPGRDYELITAHWVNGTATPSGLERSAYTQQPEKIGAPAWQLMKKLIDGHKVTERTIKVPYRIFAVRGGNNAHPPAKQQSTGEDAP